MSKHNRDRRDFKVDVGADITTIRGRIEEYSVGSWCPTPDGTGPATQVHLRFKAAGFPEMAMRFKRKQDLDIFIDTLVRHRRDVWGDL